MHRHRGRPRQEDIEFREHMMERDLAYEYEYRRRMYDYYYADEYHDYDLGLFDEEFEEYDFAYRLRMYELERAKRLRGWEEWEMAHRERMLMEDRGYPHERPPMATAEEDEMLPFPPVEERLPPPPSFHAPEHFPAPEEQENEGQQSWSPDGSWMSAQGESWNTGWGQGVGGFPTAGQKDDQDHDEDKGDMEVEDEDDDKTKEEKQIFKLKHHASIPWCYTRPHFDSNFSEFTITVSPIVYLDTVKPCFISITANASSIRINVGTKKDGVMTNSSLVLMAKAGSMKNLMRGILMQNYFSETLTITVEQRKAEESSDEKATWAGSISYPTVIHKASFTINNKAIRDHMNRMKIPDDSSSEKQSALSLHNLPKSVNWTFLRHLFPLSLNGQVIEGEPRSVLIHLRSPKMALLHVASISGLQIDGQYVYMTTDVPPTEAVQMLREVEEEATPAPIVPKKKKKLSPSDIRRNLRKKAELEQRNAQNAQLPSAPPFPGIPRLMNMSFSGPGNTPTPFAPKNPRTPAGTSAFSGTGAPVNTARKRTGATAAGMKRTSASGSDDTSDRETVPVPQMLEGPYPPASDYYAPGTPSAAGTSQKFRTAGYYRRRGARMSVYLTHMWGGDVEAAGKILARSLLPDNKKPPLIMPSPRALSVTPLTEAQLRRLKQKVHENVSMEDMRKAEEYWQRKRKEREAAGLNMHSQQVQAAMEAEGMGEEDMTTEKSLAKTKRDQQRMTEYNRKKIAMNQAAAQGYADTGAGNDRASAATESSSPDLQRNQGASSEAGHGSNPQASSYKPAAQPEPFRAPAPRPSGVLQPRFRATGPKPFRHPVPQPSGALQPRYRTPGPKPFRHPAPQPSQAPGLRFQAPASQSFRAPASKTSSQTWNQFSNSQEQWLMPPPPPPPTLRLPPSPQSAPSTQSPFFQPPDPSSTAAQLPQPPRGQYSQHAPSQSAAPSSQEPFTSTRPPRPASATQHGNTQPASSWKPGSGWGSASKPPAQVGQNQHRSPSTSHQQGSTSRWDRESQQQQQMWSREPGGLPRTSGTNTGGQSYNPYTPQQYEGFWQRGGVLKDGQENADSSAMNNRYHVAYGQQYY